MKKTMVKVLAATMLMSAGVAFAEDQEFHEGDIPPQPSAMGNAVAETFNAIKHATIDVLHQEQADRNAMLKLGKSLQAQIKTLKEKRGTIEKLQRQQLNAAVNAAKTANGDEDKQKKAAELKQASDDLKQADADLIKAEKIVTGMKDKIVQAAKERNPVALTKEWANLRNSMQGDNKVLMGLATSATGKIASADEVIAKHKGTSTSSKGDETGSFKVTLTKWSCKKTELYINDQKVFGKDADKDPVAIGKDGAFKLKATIVDPRREQARGYIGKKQVGSITITAADDSHLAYSNGTKATDWKVVKEEYKWEKPTGNSVDYNPNGAETTITYPTVAPTNNIHGWVKAEIKWKGAAEEEAEENCSYDLNLAPAR